MKVLSVLFAVVILLSESFSFAFAARTASGTDSRPFGVGSFKASLAWVEAGEGDVPFTDGF